jgi:hypothetical protein
MANGKHIGHDRRSEASFLFLGGATPLSFARDSIVKSNYAANIHSQAENEFGAAKEESIEKRNRPSSNLAATVQSSLISTTGESECLEEPSGNPVQVSPKSPKKISDAEIQEWQERMEEEKQWWGNFWGGKGAVIWFSLFIVGFLILSSLSGWKSNEQSFIDFLGGLGVAFFLWLLIGGLGGGIYKDRIRSDPNSVQSAFDRALQEHGIALREEQSVAEAKKRRKRSYWKGLTGYQVEEATAEVLKLHGFEAEVTPGSGDGGVDIEIARDGRTGVVQCKAHVAPVGPSVVRELYGVIHHCKADFGIVVSLNGFTTRTKEFAHGKLILLVDVDDLVAMQEGIDVVGKWLKHVFEA